MSADPVVALIANPLAGKGAAVARAHEAARSLVARGLPAHVAVPASAQDAKVLAAEAVQAGARAVVACGGDGTMHAIVQSVAGSQIPFAVLPGGTGDDNARQLGTPMAVEAWAEAASVALVTDRLRWIDLGRASTADVSAWFMGVMSTGFDSCVNERANRMRWPRGRAKYLVGIVAELGAFTPLPYRVSIDGVEHHQDGMLVCVGNGASYGGGMLVCPQAQMDDGILDLTWLARVPKTTFLRVLPRVFSGSHVHHPAVQVLRGTTIRIEAPGQVAYADGERLGPVPVDVSIVPRALRVIDFRSS